MEHGEKMALSFQRGEEEGFEYFFNTLFNYLVNFAINFLKDEDTAKDVVEKAFVTTWEKREIFTHPLVIKDYLFVSVKNGCLGVIKNQEYRESKSEEINYYEIERLSVDEADKKLILSETKAIVHNWLKQLPAECGKIMKLMYVDGLTSREIAKQLDLEISTVKNQKARGLEYIKSINEGKYKKKEVLTAVPKAEITHNTIPLELANIIFIEVPITIEKKEKPAFIPWKNTKRRRLKDEGNWWAPSERNERIYQMYNTGTKKTELMEIFDLSESHINNVIVNEGKSEKVKELFLKGKRVRDISRIAHLTIREAIERVNYLFKIKLYENENRTCIATYSSVFKNNQSVQGKEGAGDINSVEAQYGSLAQVNGV